MIIQCPECSTRFKLADDKLKPEGMKVRCAKCRHIFALLPPEPDVTVAEAEAEAEGRPSIRPGETEDPWAESFNEMLDDSSSEEPPADQEETSWDEALESSFADVGMDISEPSPTKPEETQDLLTPSLEPPETDGADLDAADLGLDEGEPALAESDLSLPSFTPEPLISEDLFGETTPSVEEGAPKTTAAPMADVDEFQFEEVGEEEEFAFEDAPDSKLDPFAAASASDEIPIDKTEDLDDALFPEETGGHEAIAEFSFQEEGVDAFSFAPEKTESSEAFAFEEDDLFAPEPPAGVADSIFDETPQTDSLLPDGEEKGFEFSDMEDSVVIDRSTKEVPIPVAAARPAAERLPSSVIDELPEPLSEPRHKAAETKRGPLATVLRIFVLLLLLLAASAGYLIWRGGANSLPQILEQFQTLTGTAPPTEPAVHIRLPLPNSFFVMNQHAGQLFVIQGEAVNGYPEPRSAISVTGMLHDAKGDVLLRQTVFCGNPMDLETLKSAPFAAIQEILNNPFGSALANVNIAPDTPIPYMIVFRDLPDNVTHFTVEVADSKVGEGR